MKRLGFVGIIIGDRKESSAKVNAVLSQFGDIIIARLGLPDHGRGASVITLVVDATTDEVGALTGKLGVLTGVSVKSALEKS
jgi:putative iron-only hydrogenase system regulator